MRTASIVTAMAGLGCLLLGCPASLAAPVPAAEKTPVATQPRPALRQAWARKLAGLEQGNWNQAFAIGLQLASLPPDDGFAIVEENWAKIVPVDARQQLLKAWFYTTPYPLHPRNHPRLAEVLELGLKDPSPEVRKWAQEFSEKAGAQAAATAPADPMADVADIPAQDRHAGGDARKRYFLIGAGKGAEAPAGGYGLLIVLPGGDGSAGFQPFVRRLYKNVLNQRWLAAQLVAHRWDGEQSDDIVWPTEKNRPPVARFTTEEFIGAVLTDVKANATIDLKRVFLLGWSSSGPACYALALREKTPVTGAFIAMSVFKPGELPAVENARGRTFFLLQSPDDRVTPFRFADAAEKALRTAGAKVRLQRYEGGHGWRGRVWDLMAEGIAWLEKQAVAKP